MTAAIASAQEPGWARPEPALASPSDDSVVPEAAAEALTSVTPLLRFRSRADSLTWAATSTAAARAEGLRVIVSLSDRRLWVVLGQDTLRSAPAGIGMDSTLSFGTSVWLFETPRGARTVLAKNAAPVWTPPDWHYVEVARKHGLQVSQLRTPVRLVDGRLLEVRGPNIGVVGPDSVFAFLPMDEEVVFDNTLFIPPIGTEHRRITGILGPYALDLGNGYLLHGTPFADSIGAASTHGCIRLRDDDVMWLYEFVPAGTRVYIY
ncbi:MAG: L,D-transpeptidase [Gemmatimonadota bacterium]|nr:L,D-transpeptidase [Gemmatimonadota bacterium]